MGGGSYTREREGTGKFKSSVGGSEPSSPTEVCQIKIFDGILKAA